CAAKAAELKITQALRLELSGTGVCVGTIDPGLAETEFSIVRFKGDTERAKKVYEGINPLTAEDIAEALVWAASRPPHVCIDEMLIKCTDQAAIHKVHRRTQDRKSTRLNSSHVAISYAVFCLKKKKDKTKHKKFSIEDITEC